MALLQVKDIEFAFGDEPTEKEKQDMIDDAIDLWEVDDEDSLRQKIEDRYGYEVTYISYRVDYH